VEVCGKELRIRGRLIRIAFLDGEGYDFLEDPQAALQALRKSGGRIDLFTFVQKLSDTKPKYCYPMEWENWAVLRISTLADWMTRQADSRVRTKVRKAVKYGVTVREAPFDDAYIQGIHAIYNECPIRQGKPFWHYGKDLEAVRKMNATFIDRSIFIGAYFEGNLIGFGKLVFNEDRSQAGLMQILSVIGHREKAPTNALIAQAVQSCAERGIPYLWYGQMCYGTKRGDSLAEFKRHNGFQRIDLPRYYVPLTVPGLMGLRLGLHHRFAESCPEPLAATYRRIRSLWYARRFHGPQNA
jgi:hypothetical protein